MTETTPWWKSSAWNNEDEPTGEELDHLFAEHDRLSDEYDKHLCEHGQRHPDGWSDLPAGETMTTHYDRTPEGLVERHWEDDILGPYEASSPRSKPIFDAEMGGPSGKLKKLMDNMDHVDPDPHLSDLYGDAKWDRDYQRLVGGRHGFQGGYEAELDNGGGIAYHKGGVWTNNTGRKIPVAHVIKPVLAANPDKMVDSDPAQEVQYFGVSSIPGDEGQLYRTLHEAVMRPNSLANRWNHPGRGYEPRPVPQGARKISVFNADNMSQDERTPSWREVGQANEEDAEGPLGEWEKANPDKRIDNNRLMSLPYGYIPWTHFPNPDDKEWPEESERFPSKANMEQNVVQPMVGIKETGDPRDITVGHDFARWPGRPWGPGDWEMTDGLTGKPTHEMVFNDEVDEHGEPVRHEAARVRPTWENRQQEPTLHSEFGSPKVRGELPSHTIHYAENGQSAACGNRNPEGSSNNVTHVTCNSCRHTVAYNMAPSPQYPNGRSYDEVTRRQKRQAAPRDFTGGHDQTKPHPSLPYAKKQGLGPGCSGSCTYGGTHCAICHEPVAYNLHTAFQYDHQGDGHPVGAGWHHADGLRRDHEAVPADPQGLIDSIPGQIAKKDQVRQQVRDHLDNQFRSIDPSYRPRPRGDEGEMPLDPFLAKAAANADESGLKAAGIAVIAMDTGRVLMQQRALNPVTCPCGQGVTWDDQNGYQHDDGSVSHDGEFAGQSVSDLLDQGHLEKEAAYEDDWNPPDAEDLGISQEELNEWQAQHPGMVATEYHGNGMMSFVDPSMREDHSEARSSNSFGNPLIEAKHALPDYGWGDLDEEGNVVPNHERFDAPQRYVDSNPVCQTCFDKHDAIRDERTHDAYQEYTRQQIDNAERYGNHHHADELRNTIHPYKPALPHPGERRLGSTVKESVQPFQQTWGYGEGHVAPYHRGDNASMDDVEGTMPGFYKRPSLYGTSLADQEAHAKIRAVRGNPDARVRVYRVVPHGISNIYGQNDLKQAFPNRDLAEWVTPSATYARDMARQPCPKCGQPSQVITGVVRAGDLLTEGYPTEFGYVGDETVPHSGTNKIFKNRCPRPVKTVEANWWEERKPAQIKETDSGGRVPFYADSYEDYEGEAPEWFRTVDPDHPNHQNPSGDSFMELKGMSDSGTPMEIDPSNGKPCETCWLGERLWGSYPPQHFEGTGHVPMEMPRYVAALYHGPEFDAEQAALTTPGAVANWVDDDHGIVHWTHPDYQRPLGSGGGHHMFSIKDDFSDYYHDPDRQSEDKDGYTDDSLLDHDTAYVHIFPKESALEHDPNEGTWEFPGGKLDPGENARQAAIREFREEVGQDLPPGVFVGAWLSPGGLVVAASTEEEQTLVRKTAAGAEAPFGDVADFHALGWNQTDPTHNGEFEKFNNGFHHKAKYVDDHESPTGYSWELSSFAGHHSRTYDGDPIWDEYGDLWSNHLTPQEVAFNAKKREGLWLKNAVGEDSRFIEPMSKPRPVMIPSEDDEAGRGWDIANRAMGEKSKPFSAHEMDPAHPYSPMNPHRYSAVQPVYKGFIYLIQHERDIDLSNREHANPDDPDGDMSEQSAWWDIADAKKNPALRKEVKSIPWSELELWADKSVRSNKEIKEAFAKLAAVEEEHPDPKLEPPGIVSERGDLSFGYPQPMGQYKWMPSKGPMCATCYDTNGDKVAQSEHERFLRNHDKPHHPFEKLATVDPRPELPEGLYYQDAAESPWATQKDDEEETKFWRYRDPELVPPFNDADRWQEGVNESHGRTVDWQPMIMIKPQSEFGEDRDFDAAHHSRERTDVKWDEPICETCYLRNGSTVPAGSHWFAMDKYYNDLGQPKHDFKPLLPDVDEKGNLKQGAAGTSAEPDPYDRALAGDESKLPREPVNLPGKEDNVLPGDPAKGENWWKYKHASLKDYLAEKRGPRADAWPYVRQAIEAGKPEYIMRYLDEVDPSHHEAFMANDRPYYYEDPNFKKEDMPVVYGVRNRRETTFVAPVTHAQTGENGYLRGVAERDPSTWEFYPESQVQKAILGQPLTYRPQTPVSRANDRYQRGWASGERVPNDNMVRLDDEGHQIVQPHTDPFEEFARQVGGWSDEVPPAPPKRRPKLTAAEEPWWRF